MAGRRDCHQWKDNCGYLPGLEPAEQAEQANWSELADGGYMTAGELCVQVVDFGWVKGVDCVGQ
jgi:hypothetical protein